MYHVNLLLRGCEFWKIITHSIRHRADCFVPRNDVLFDFSEWTQTQTLKPATRNPKLESAPKSGFSSLRPWGTKGEAISTCTLLMIEIAFPRNRDRQCLAMTCYSTLWSGKKLGTWNLKLETWNLNTRDRNDQCTEAQLKFKNFCCIWILPDHRSAAKRFRLFIRLWRTCKPWDGKSAPAGQHGGIFGGANN